MIDMNPIIQINDRHEWTKMGTSSSCLVAPYAKLMAMISGSACHICQVKIPAVSMGELPRMGHGTNDLVGESFGRIRFLFILLQSQHGPREGIVYGKQI